jgi:hypothetical protein
LRTPTAHSDAEAFDAFDIRARPLRQGEFMWPRSTIETLEPRRLLHGNPAITISDVALAEGDDGATAYVFTVSLSKATSRRVSVNFATAADGTAVAGEDFESSRGTLTFARGQTSRTVTVLVNGDATVEGDETFSLKLSRANNAFIADSRGIGTIVNDDLVAPPPPPPPPPAPPPYQPPPDPWYDPAWWNPPGEGGAYW